MNNQEVEIEEQVVSEIIPEFWLIKLEEREYWTEDIQAQTESIFSVYAFDKNREVHLCEFTPSYELRYLYTDCFATDRMHDDEEQREILDEEIRTGASDNQKWEYMHCSDIDKIPEVKNAVFDASNQKIKCNLSEQRDREDWKRLLEDNDNNYESAYWAAMDEIEEYQQGNPEWS